MTVTISDKAKAIVALCEAKDKLQALAQKNNVQGKALFDEYIADTAARDRAFQTRWLDHSAVQSEILAKMIEIDDTIKKIAAKY